MVFSSDAFETSSHVSVNLINTRVDILMKGYSPKFEGKRARIGGVREVSDFSTNLEFSAKV